MTEKTDAATDIPFSIRPHEEFKKLQEFKNMSEEEPGSGKPG